MQFAAAVGGPARQHAHADRRHAITLTSASISDWQAARTAAGSSLASAARIRATTPPSSRPRGIASVAIASCAR
jgi:hypothetical protein